MGIAKKKILNYPRYKKNQKRKLNNQTEKQLLKQRIRIEITINQLKDQFQLTKLRAKTLLGLVTKVIGIMLSLTIAILVNRILGRPDLKVKELLL